MWGSDPTFGIGLLLAWTICIGAGSTLLHEYGHAWTARAVGWDVVALRWRWYGVAGPPFRRGVRARRVETSSI